MSRLEQLIGELCPNGVEYDQLNTVVDYEQPTKYIVENTNYDDKFETPVLTAGQSFVLGYTNETNDIYIASKENPTIIFDDFTTSFHWVNFNFKIKSSAMKMLRIKSEKREEVLLRYVYHCMRKIRYEPVDHSRQWIAKYSLFTIPLPHIEIQREIVRILDNFTELTAELTAELTDRKKQYEYYRENLFAFNDDGFTNKPLEQLIISLNTGLNPRQFFQLNPSDAKNFYVTIRELKNNKIVFNEKTDRINDEALKLCNNRSNLEVDDVLFSGTGTIGEVAIIDAHPTNWNIKEGVYTIKPNKALIVPKYLLYILRTGKIRKLFLSKAAGGTVKSVSMGEMKKLEIPIPYPNDIDQSLAEQQRIVDILDRFDTLCNDISNGLPAEIDERQQQYEYYRDKLLTFKNINDEV